jgi:hypothetical protein
MVFHFTSVDGYVIYMGRDKYENEILIKYAWPEDIWFHVDDLSSAHVYLRLPRGSPAMKRYRETGKLDHLEKTLMECLQLTKANSIEGSKANKVDIVYTHSENLKKTGDMAVGQVSFHDPKLVVTVKNVERDREILNRINKTKEEFDKHENEFANERQIRDREVIAMKKERARMEEKARLQEKEEREKKQYEMSYDRLFEKPKSNNNNNFEDDSGEGNSKAPVPSKIVATTDLKTVKKMEEDFL